jgi:DNA polymerase III gamma/tau subunit
MFIPDVINTLLMGLIFMVIVVTVVRPFVMHIVNGAMSTEDLQKEAIEAVHQEVMRVSLLNEAQRHEQIRFQQLLLEVPEKLKPEPEPEVELEEEEDQVLQEAEAQTESTAETADADEGAEVATDGEVAETEDGDAAEDAETSGEIVMQEGETLADVKARMKREQAKAKKPTIPPELLNNANSYEDKVGVVRMVVQNDQSRVANVIRSMIET